MFTTTAQQLAALEVCTTWLAANVRLETLRWQDEESGRMVSLRPSDDLFMGADDATYDVWETMEYQDQWCCLLSAADELTEREQLMAGAV
jgi:hypothetical protein